MLHRWVRLERRLAHRHDPARPQFAADRLKLAATLRSAEREREDVNAAWDRGELETAQMLAAEWECLSVEVASLEALVAYEAALVRVQAIIDRP